MIDSFHLIRPLWLWALLPALGIFLQLHRRGDSRQVWKKWVDPALLDALLVQGDQKRRIRPLSVLGLFWVGGIFALAGPAWHHETSPFAEDSAALVIVLKVTPSMEATDLAPSRQQRAAQKISDLLDARPTAKNALVAYAGSAHLVMPLTTDGSVIKAFAQDLEPSLMPRFGNDVQQALAVAGTLLAKNSSPGAILFVADDLGDTATAAFAEYRKSGGVPVHVLAATATPPQSLRVAARAGGGMMVAMTPDQTDIDQLTQGIQKTAASAVDDGGERWKDSGVILLPLLALMSLLGFRKGWVVR